VRRGGDTAPYLVLGAVAVLPADRDEADGDSVQEFPAIQTVSDLCHGIYVGGELDALEQES